MMTWLMGTTVGRRHYLKRLSGRCIQGLPRCRFCQPLHNWSIWRLTVSNPLEASTTGWVLLKACYYRIMDCLRLIMTLGSSWGSWEWMRIQYTPKPMIVSYSGKGWAIFAISLFAASLCGAGKLNEGGRFRWRCFNISYWSHVYSGCSCAGRWL